MRTESRGFTLLEVLVALAIVALGLMAAFGQLNQTAATATRLREKTFAHWVAQDRLVELRLLREFPAVGNRSDEVEFGGVAWKYTLRVSQTPLEGLRRVDVDVAFADRPDRVITTLSGFLRRPPAVPPAAGAAPEDWYVLDPDADGG